ncbi:hypothetical protein WG66_011630 [Moniliophthora roreri]|nr:hypothetical protein WG66_011630 [Moniliophthora roreri]
MKLNISVNAIISVILALAVSRSLASCPNGYNGVPCYGDNSWSTVVMDCTELRMRKWDGKFVLKNQIRSVFSSCDTFWL